MPFEDGTVSPEDWSTGNKMIMRAILKSRPNDDHFADLARFVRMALADMDISPGKATASGRERYLVEADVVVQALEYFFEGQMDHVTGEADLAGPKRVAKALRSNGTND